MSSRLLLSTLVVCFFSSSLGAAPPIQIAGSDSMIALVAAWAKEFEAEKQKLVEVTGGGTGGGFSKLASAKAQVAMATRKITPAEAEKVKKNLGKAPLEIVVCYDAVTVLVPKDSKLKRLSIEELADIYSAAGKLEKWEQIDGSGQTGTIQWASPNVTTGAYFFFSESVAKSTVGKSGTVKAGGVVVPTVKDMLDFVGLTPSSLGYTQAAFADPRTEALALSVKKGGEAIAPTPENIRAKTYPLARELYFYAADEPAGDLLEFLTWLKGKEAQEIATRQGFTPVR